MTREGVKEEADRKRREEDVISSALMRLYLGCGNTGRERFLYGGITLKKVRKTKTLFVNGPVYAQNHMSISCIIVC